jgi:hypothetical protein
MQFLTNIEYHTYVYTCSLLCLAAFTLVVCLTFMHVVAVTVHFFLLLSTYQLVDIWAVSSLRQLWIKLLWTSEYKS